MAFDINKVFIIGRLTRDPELSFTKSDIPVCRFSVANNSGSKDNEVNFFDIVAWQKTATSCGQYLKKGGQVAIDGRLQQSRWTDKDGTKRSRVEVVANTVQFIGGKSEPHTTETSAPNGDQETYDLTPDSVGDENPF